MAQPQSTTLDGLPKRFVLAMRTLFDIMDDSKTGYVRFSDIEQWWQDDGAKGLPQGVIDCLQKVTPPNGLLSFERFCAGLKICLLRNQVETQKLPHKAEGMEGGKTQPKRPPSAPILDLPDPVAKPSWSNTATVRPNNAIAQRTNSMPQLMTEQTVVNGVNGVNVGSEGSKYPATHQALSHQQGVLYGPPKPPRSATGLERAALLSTETPASRGLERLDRLDRAEIRTALQNWQKGVLLGDLDKGVMQRPRSSGDGKPAGYVDQQALNGVNGVNGVSGASTAPGVQPAQNLNLYKKTGARRREPRRHTLQNGIDYNMLKRIKQVEQEKDVLMQGLAAVERTREWYLKQVAITHDKMRYLGQQGVHLDQWSETQAEKLELQRARVLEVNRHLTALTESWERGGLPLHMNLAVLTGPPADVVTRVKHQNRLLTKEVSQKSERITLLEQEKATLLRELYQARAVLQGRQLQQQGEGGLGFM